MSVVNMNENPSVPDFLADIEPLALRFGKRASEHDQAGEFVYRNYADLRNGGFFAAAIPVELGGGGVTFTQLCEIVRVIGRHCGSTALAFAMHSHAVAANVYKYRHGDDAAAKSLSTIAAKRLIIATTGANDWLGSSGTAVKTNGGYSITAHKRFVSGAPGASVLATSAILGQGEDGEVLHFVIPMDSQGIEIVNTWDTLGMRGTGSNDVVMNEVFVPESAIAARRAAGEWHPMWGVIVPSALPLISAAYVGMAETAAGLAVKAAKFQAEVLAGPVGEMGNALGSAKIVLQDMVRMNDNHSFEPSLDTANSMLVRKSLVAKAVKESVELAAELIGGPGFFRGHAIERIVRDVRALHFHPLPARRQQVFSGRLALGLKAG
jgi:alkylation response protein AidB-like acyl-CoA dehydrogenase